MAGAWPQGRRAATCSAGGTIDTLRAAIMDTAGKIRHGAALSKPRRRARPPHVRRADAAEARQGGRNQAQRERGLIDHLRRLPGAFDPFAQQRHASWRCW